MSGDGLDDAMQNDRTRCSMYGLMVRDSPQRVNFSATSSDHPFPVSLSHLDSALKIQ